MGEMPALLFLFSPSALWLDARATAKLVSLSGQCLPQRTRLVGSPDGQGRLGVRAARQLLCLDKGCDQSPRSGGSATPVPLGQGIGESPATGSPHRPNHSPPHAFALLLDGLPERVCHRRHVQERRVVGTVVSCLGSPR